MGRPLARTIAVKRTLLLELPPVAGHRGFGRGIGPSGHGGVKLFESLAALATTQPCPGAFGAGVVGVAQDPNLPPPGLGDGIQAPQAGQVPDEVVPNTCNGLSRSGPNEPDPRAAGHDLASSAPVPTRRSTCCASCAGPWASLRARRGIDCELHAAGGVMV
jgi:hypothetical protein